WSRPPGRRGGRRRPHGKLGDGGGHRTPRWLVVHEGWVDGQQPSSGGLPCADGSQTWSPLGQRPPRCKLPGQAITSARPTDLVISRSRQQIDLSTHLARARGLEPLTRRLDVDVATSAHPDQPRMLAASKPPCQPTPDRPPARQVQAKWRPVVSQATCTPVLSSSWSDGPDRMIGGDAFNALCPSTLASAVGSALGGWLACVL
ncbi:MAG: hypothetical protein K0S88_3540, partial [Actinomycetia bacterium]|nr:hypothetical protein [Actinomycetes bacterium]